MTIKKPKNKYRVICKVNRELYPRYSYFKDFICASETIKFCHWALIFGHAENVKIIILKNRTKIINAVSIDTLVKQLENLCNVDVSYSVFKSLIKSGKDDYTVQVVDEINWLAGAL